MATSTLIQRLDVNALKTSTTIPGGYEVVSTPDVSNRRQIETFIAGATVVAGDWLQFDTSKSSGPEKVLTVIQAATSGAGNALVVGVCLGSAETSGALTVGSKINVIVSGLAEKANVAGGLGVGTPIQVSATAGRAQATILPAAVGSASACGVTLSTVTANVAQVWVYKQF